MSKKSDPKTLSPKTLSPKVSGRIFSGTESDIAGGEKTWRLADEVPLVLFYNSEQLGVMMITPSDFEDFCIGFSLTQGIVKSYQDILDIRFETITEGMLANIIVGKEALKIARERKRAITAGSSCGICGAQTLAAVMPVPKKNHGLVAKPFAMLKALKTIDKEQIQNSLNFSTHGAALADKNGKIMLLREDVGRHNALDKLAGAMAKKGLSGTNGFLVLTCRFSVEMAQKAASIGFSSVATISAPTVLALKTAKQAAMEVATLSGDELMVFYK
ncbi:MAG: formate dehydrogenase accessory sulfurtransferase FdhD [Devosiaceae bacterium]|nr:formate dehydrogenase accessory sulfurtransferase FdhD [Devosiaceae bacterium]